MPSGNGRLHQRHYILGRGQVRAGQGHRAVCLHGLFAGGVGIEQVASDLRAKICAGVVLPFQIGGHILLHVYFGFWPHQVAHLAQYPGQGAVAYDCVSHGREIIFRDNRHGISSQVGTDRIHPGSGAPLQIPEVDAARDQSQRISIDSTGQHGAGGAAVARPLGCVPDQTAHEHCADVNSGIAKAQDTAHDCAGVIQQLWAAGVALAGDVASDGT